MHNQVEQLFEFGFELVGLGASIFFLAGIFSPF
jgi:hypothetical protein